MDRISAEELTPPNLDTLTLFQLGQLLKRAAYTITEMDKDIAVFEAQMETMQRQHRILMEEEGP